MAVPYRRVSKTRKAKRRTHQRASSNSVVACNNCGINNKQHNVCKSCGYYKNKEIIKLEKE